eukprot:215267-Chlamydomonas_euryale.AAC.3
MRTQHMTQLSWVLKSSGKARKPCCAPCMLHNVCDLCRPIFTIGDVSQIWILEQAWAPLPQHADAILTHDGLSMEPKACLN